MMFDPTIHHRQSIRWRTHDYAAGGMYYITICTEERRRLFGVVVNSRMALNEAGCAVRDEWLKSAEIRHEIVLDEWVVMPDHFHAIVVIRNPGDLPVTNVGDLPVAPTGPLRTGDRGVALPNGPAPKSLGALIAGFKSASGHRINQLRNTRGATVWQRNYYEHIVRNDADLARIRTYIRANPANWDVLRYGDPRFMIGNRTLLDLPKTAYLASRGGWKGDPPVGDQPVAPTASCVISGFLSPMERAVFDVCLADNTPMIQVLACRLPKTLPPRVQRAMDAGRLLVMTPFDETVARVNAERAAWCNQYLLHAADRVVIGHLNPDGMLACLLSDMPADKPIVIAAFPVGATGGSPTGGSPSASPLQRGNCGGIGCQPRHEGLRGIR